MIGLSNVGAFTGSIRDSINQNFAMSGFGTVGQILYLDPANGYDASATPNNQSTAYKTLAAAYAAANSGKNDVIVLIGDGATTATARVDVAFIWAKNATHLIGLCAPGLLSQRSRIAPTAATTAFANFFTVSGNGCVFQNIQWFHGFTTGVASSICMTVTGQRNVFSNCQFAGMGDAASAADAGSRSLKVGGSGAGENLFLNCTVGSDATSRGAANASLELYGATPRNIFRGCIFPITGSAAGVLGILGTGAGCVDRWTLFDGCAFLNGIKSGSTQMTVLASLTNAWPGGYLVFQNCTSVGSTKLGDTIALANSYVNMAAVSGSAGGLGVNPS